MAVMVNYDRECSRAKGTVACVTKLTKIKTVKELTENISSLVSHMRQVQSSAGSSSNWIQLHSLKSRSASIHFFDPDQIYLENMRIHIRQHYIRGKNYVLFHLNEIFFLKKGQKVRLKKIIGSFKEQDWGSLLSYIK